MYFILKIKEKSSIKVLILFKINLILTLILKIKKNLSIR
jgi:hypothetical protein